MPNELLFVIAAVPIGLLAVLAVMVRPRAGRAADPGAQAGPAAERAATRAGAPRIERTALLDPAGDPEAGVDRVLRVTWWVTIASVLIGVGVSRAYPQMHAQIYALGAIAVITVVILHEVLPASRARNARAWIEAAMAIGLATALVGLTGRGESPFFFTFGLVAVAVALTRGGRATSVACAAASLAYLGVLAFDPQRPSFATADYLRFALNVASIWLLAYLGGMFAAHERRERQAMEALSISDHLTGLFNRSQILSTIDREIRRTRRSERGFCLLMIDLDGLKAVNDSLGHHRGDDVLRQLGAIIRRSIRAVDSAYRYGGDEFFVLLPETDIVGAFVVAEKVRAGAEEVGAGLAEGIETSVSIGLVSHPEDGLTVEELMVAADRAMYQAKTSGKNQIAGAPRVRRPGAQPAAPAAPPAPAPPATPAAAAAPVGAWARPMEVGSQPPPAPPPAAIPVGRDNGRAGHGGTEAESGPRSARERVPAARGTLDSDDQVRRAMDAFLSPPSRER